MSLSRSWRCLLKLAQRKGIHPPPIATRLCIYGMDSHPRLRPFCTAVANLLTKPGCMTAACSVCPAAEEAFGAGGGCNSVDPPPLTSSGLEDTGLSTGAGSTFAADSCRVGRREAQAAVRLIRDLRSCRAGSAM